MLEPFVRGDDARTMDESTGFGLGLSIARAIAIAHGGELSLHDRAPHGLIVRMQLPVCAAAAAGGVIFKPRAAGARWEPRQRSPPPRSDNPQARQFQR